MSRINSEVAMGNVSLRLRALSALRLIPLGFVFRGAHEFMLSLNTTASSHLYVGPILLQDKAFMKAWTGIQPAIASVIIALTFCPHWLRYLVGPYVPPVKRLKALNKVIRTFLFPLGGSIPNVNTRQSSNITLPPQRYLTRRILWPNSLF